MTRRHTGKDYVQQDGTWYDPTPSASISGERVVRYADEERPDAHVLLSQALEAPPGRRAGAAEVGQLR
ncbi:hypothetical protein [Saccharothrix coeruleofusca]|uniref:Uncharacterized protein n=1 Tax=Saccharothrix coeruleofusca TaxID=33919 RepID=A0A918AWH3_9PSEU|nr:hypothetical protein [Saccharothrix coeruleofusca]MBP2338878.1 hypothetical protein [Saccharothrix coeruleofusca]GGP86962.1 hypothetical protein GCM10010185_70970 [Saccharothrix coeruleofusca]